MRKMKKIRDEGYKKYGNIIDPMAERAIFSLTKVFEKVR